MQEGKRTLVLTQFIAGRISIGDAALFLGLSERSVWRLRARLLAGGPQALAHGNRGRAPAHRLDPALVEQVVDLARRTYPGLNDSHFHELIHEREGLRLSRRSVQRILRRANIASPRRRRVPKYRSRRERRAREGMLVQLDGSRHRWFGASGPYATLLGAIDDATGEVLAATFREQEDAAGYLLVLRSLLERHGAPLAVYSDRHGIFWRSSRERESLAEELRGRREPTQLGRAFAELEVEMIFAHSPQAKGRIERLWGTFQDRLVAELRLERITTLEQANAFLLRYLPRHNARFAVPPADTQGAWRALPPGKTSASVCCFKYSRLVAGDNTVSLEGVLLQLPPRGVRASWARQRVELRQYLDGSWSVHAPGGRELARSAVPKTPPLVRARAYVRAPIAGVQPLPRDAAHPWRKWQPGQFKRRVRVPKSETA